MNPKKFLRHVSNINGKIYKHMKYKHTNKQNQAIKKMGVCIWVC